MKLRTFRIGAPRRPGEGLRIGATRRPPRGVRRADWRRRGYFDVWLPAVAPSLALLRRYQQRIQDDERARRRFFAAYARELSQPGPRHVVDLLAAIASRTPIAIGCFCEDESRCHRSVLRRAIERAGRREERDRRRNVMEPPPGRPMELRVFSPAITGHRRRRRI